MSAINVLSRVATKWAVRAFGMDHMKNTRERSFRMTEEAIELCQATNVPKEMLHSLVEHVYSKPAGSVNKELGQVVLTTCLLCATFGYSIEDLMERELHDIFDRPPEWYGERLKRKTELGLVLP